MLQLDQAFKDAIYRAWAKVMADTDPIGNTTLLAEQIYKELYGEAPAEITSESDKDLMIANLRTQLEEFRASSRKYQMDAMELKEQVDMLRKMLQERDDLASRL